MDYSDEEDIFQELENLEDDETMQKIRETRIRQLQDELSSPILRGF
jgi:hypothetical protein